MQAALCTSIDHLVRYLCTLLNYDLSLSDEVLRLLIDYRWDADKLVDYITAGRNANVTNISDSSKFDIERQSYRNLFNVHKRVECKKVKSSKDFAHCPCGIRASLDSMYALMGCCHWYCKNCWIGIISYSLHTKHTDYFETSFNASSSPKYSSIFSSLARSRTNLCSDSVSKSTWELSSNQGEMWQCPHVDCTHRLRCTQKMRGDFVNHLCGTGNSATRLLFYYSQLYACANLLLTKSLVKIDNEESVSNDKNIEGGEVVTEASTIAMTSWWRNTNINSDRDKDALGSSIDLNSNQKHLNADDNTFKPHPNDFINASEAQLLSKKKASKSSENQNPHSVHIPNLFQSQHPAVVGGVTMMLSVDTYERLLKASSAAGISREDSKIKSASTDDGPISARYQMLSERYHLLYQILILLARTHAIVAAETTRNEIREMEMQAGGKIKGSKYSKPLPSCTGMKRIQQFGIGWSDVSGLHLLLQSTEALTVIFAETLLKAVELTDDQNCAPQTQSTLSQIGIMTKTLRSLRFKLLRDTNITFIQEDMTSPSVVMQSHEIGFGVLPFSLRNN